MAQTHTPDSNLGRVLVTGGSGFVATHLIIQLLNLGYQVTATIRNSSQEERVRDIVKSSSTSSPGHLSFIFADLTSDSNWTEAMRGCSFVHHVASPFPSHAPKDEQELILVAKEGTLRVLRHAQVAGVRRVVMTSSFAAIGYGYQTLPLFTEDYWSIIDGKIPVPAYQKSKVVAEKAAWDFIASEGGSLQLTVINPTGIFGPIISNSGISSSIQLIQAILSGKMSSGCPRLSFGVVDVRDVADLHIRAMTSERANGERFLATCDYGAISMIEISDLLRAKRPEMASKAPTRALPNLAIRAMSLFQPALRGSIPELGVIKKMSNEKAKSVLGWEPRPLEQCLLDTVDSLREKGVA